MVNWSHGGTRPPESSASDKAVSLAETGALMCSVSLLGPRSAAGPADQKSQPGRLVQPGRNMGVGTRRGRTQGPAGPRTGDAGQPKGPQSMSCTVATPAGNEGLSLRPEGGGECWARQDRDRGSPPPP